ncbi:hypothetical protein [Zobellella denitrificans]
MNIRIIQKSQKQYFDLIKSYKKLIFSDAINQKIIAMIIDEIHCFWLDKKDILSLELENLTSEKNCFLLSGATYLDVKDNEHYLFKALGDEHIISDPLLKLESFFRIPNQVFDRESIEIFRRAYSDVLEVLSNHQNIFYILPIRQIAISDEKEQIELLHKFYLKFINSVFNDDFKDFNDFFEKYRTYDEIEKNMVSFFKANLIFDEHNDETLSLKERVEAYLNSHGVMISLTQKKSESEKFILALQNYVAQIIDILLTSSITNLTPFIRFKPTFHYLTLVMYTFIEDENFKNMIEKTIVFYIFHKTINKEKLIDMDFDMFVKITQEKDFLSIIIDEMVRKRINIFNSRIEEVSKIIEQSFLVQ